MQSDMTLLKVLTLQSKVTQLFEDAIVAIKSQQ